MLDTKLLAFLENKPADEAYNYSDATKCAAAQFDEAHGRAYDFAYAIAKKDSKTDFDGRMEKLAAQRPWNFGAMFERAKKEFEPV